MRNKHYKNDDSSETGNYPIQIYSLIATQKAKGDNREKMQYKYQAVQYVFERQKSKDG